MGHESTFMSQCFPTNTPVMQLSRHDGALPLHKRLQPYDVGLLIVAGIRCHIRLGHPRWDVDRLVCGVLTVQHEDQWVASVDGDVLGAL